MYYSLVYKFEINCLIIHQVALRVEKMILEQIEGLEDKVASAAMQVPVSFVKII